MATLTAFKQAAQLPLDLVLAEAIQEMTSVEAICARCRYRKRPRCADAALVDRGMCPVVRSQNGGT